MSPKSYTFQREVSEEGRSQTTKMMFSVYAKGQILKGLPVDREIGRNITSEAERQGIAVHGRSTGADGKLLLRGEIFDEDKFRASQPTPAPGA